jgi:hypothetical protein
MKTKAQQDLPINMTKNNRLLDMQCTKDLIVLRTQQLAVDP